MCGVNRDLSPRIQLRRSPHFSIPFHRTTHATDRPFTHNESGVSSRPQCRSLADEDVKPTWDWDWHRIVQRYSAMDLTNETDRLVALAGIAKRVQASRPDDRYLAGLWESNLVSDLAWVRNERLGIHDGEQPRKADGTRGWWSTGRISPSVPSFSWGSGNVMGRYSFPVDSISLESVRVVDVHYLVAGPVELGQSAEAYITLKSPLLQARLAPAFDTTPKATSLQAANKLTLVDLEDVEQVPMTSRKGMAFPGFRVSEWAGPADKVFGGWNVHPDYGFDVPGAENVPLGLEVLVLPLVVGYFEVVGTTKRSVRGILLRKRQEGRHERVASSQAVANVSGEGLSLLSSADPRAVDHFFYWMQKLPRQMITLC